METSTPSKTNGDKQWLIEALRMANIGNWQWDIKTDTIIWSDEIYRIYGLSPDTFEPSFQGYLDIIHPDDRKRVKEIIESTLKTKHKATFEKRIIRPNNEVRYLRAWAAVETKDLGEPIKLYGSCVDITEEKLKEIDFEKKEREYESILERVTDGVVAIDKSWVYTYVNKKAGEIFGKKSDELVGKDIWKEFPELVNEPVYKACHKAMETQKYQHLQVYYPHYQKWFVNHIYPSQEGLTIYFEDITSQKEQDEALNTYKEELEAKVKERTSELEQQNVIINKQKEEIEDIIKELHHRVKNNMQIISSLLSLQSGMVDDPKIQAMFNDSQSRVHSMALIHEKMYQSNSLTRINAKDYLPELIKDIIKSATVSKDIDLDFKVDPIEFGTKIMVPIGLLVNEIVLNSIKHAFNSVDKGKVTFQMYKTENDMCKMIIGDNGSGIDKNKPFNGDSLGMEIIETFVSQLDGTLKILEREGTVYEIEFKMNQ